MCLFSQIYDILVLKKYIFFYVDSNNKINIIMKDSMIDISGSFLNVTFFIKPT